MAITHSQIGAQFFVTLQGDLTPPAEELDDITREGVDSVAFQKRGTRGDARDLRGVAFVSTSAAAQTLVSTYRALKTTTVTIRQAEQDDTNYMILDVQVESRRQAFSVVGGIKADGTAVTDGSTLWIVRSRWSVIYVGS